MSNKSSSTDTRPTDANGNRVSGITVKETTYNNHTGSRTVEYSDGSSDTYNADGSHNSSYHPQRGSWSPC